MMTCINVTEFVLISYLEKDHSMIKTLRLKNIAIFIQTILSFVWSRKIIQITLVNILKLLCNLMIKRITKNINVFATRKKNCYFLLLYHIKGKHIYF